MVGGEDLREYGFRYGLQRSYPESSGWHAVVPQLPFRLIRELKKPYGLCEQELS